MIAGCGRSAPLEVDSDDSKPSPTETGTPETKRGPETKTDVGREIETQTIPGLPDAVALEPVARGFQFPLDVAFAPGADRRYVVDRNGLIFVQEAGGVRERPLLDLRNDIVLGGERGLLGIALHPEFASSRRLFVRYSSPRRQGTPDEYSHTFVLAEFEVSADGRRANRASERTLLEIPEPRLLHNGGAIAFGPDDYLYITVGDGGGGTDQGLGHVADWYDENGGGNGQDVTENRLGSILRIDVDDRGPGQPYGIPADNPLVGREGLDEHYAWGFRNPWRLSFDGDDLFVGDVGQNLFEEINLVEPGGNYGWNVKEGSSCFNGDDQERPLVDCPDRTPPDVRGGEPLIDPVVEYPNSNQPMAVICGYVYRGAAFPSMVGTLVFGDLRADGRLFATKRPDNGGAWPMDAIPIVDEDAGKLRELFSFGRDPAGELYALGRGEDDAGFYRIVPAG